MGGRRRSDGITIIAPVVVERRKDIVSSGEATAHTVGVVKQRRGVGEVVIVVQEIIIVQVIGVGRGGEA